MNDVCIDVRPAECVECSFVRSTVMLESFLQEAGNRALAAPDGTVKQQYPFVDSVPFCRTFQGIYQVFEGSPQAVDSVSTAINRIVEKRVVRMLFS